jgi:hypothetical protein
MTRQIDANTQIDFTSFNFPGLTVKEPAVAATTGPITLANSQSIDGEAVVNPNRVLVKDQADASENGVYVVVDAGAWTRATDFDGSPSNEVVKDTFVSVTEGTVNGGSGWIVTSPNPIVVGVDDINFQLFVSGGGGGSGSVTSVAASGSTGLSVGGSPITSTGTLTFTLSNDLQGMASGLTSGTGFVRRTGPATYSASALISGDVTGALGYTPYNASNPSGFITTNQTITLSGDATGSGTTSIAVTVVDDSHLHTVTTISATGTPNSSTFLRGDGTWATPAGGGGGTVTSVAASQPAAGITISGSPITTSGTLTFALANDLAALEALSGTGYVRRTGTDAFTTDVSVPAASVSGLAASATTDTTNAGNITSGTLPSGRLSGTYSISISGNAATATSATSASNATTAGGFTPSATAGVASRIVVADGSGYINNSYFNSTDNSQASGVTAVMVKAGDNYIRSGTAQAVATFLSGSTMNIAGNASTSSDSSALNGQAGSFYRNASNINAGTVPTANLGSGIANSTTFLRGDNTWQTISSGGVTSVTGTANRVTASPTTGAVVLTTPQDIHSSALVQFSGIGLGTSAAAGEVRATNNITAFFSDMNLKTVKAPITNALEKVCSLDGFYFTANEKAQELGYDGKEVHVGVSAQAVQKILPEVIKRAPIDDKYMTLDYAKLVPLLIEAIKDLEKQVAELRNK